MFPLAIHALAFIAASAFGQANAAEEQYYAWCASQGGTPVGSYSTLHCVPPENGGQEGGAIPSGARSPSGPSGEEQRREKDDERRRLARKKRATDDAELEAQERERFEADKARAIGELKGVDAGDTRIKGDSAGMQGLKDVGVSDAGLKTLDDAGAWTPRAFATASEQLRCGSSLARQALVAAGAAGRSEAKAAKARALIASLDGQAANAFSGAPVEMPCDAEGPPLKFRASPRRSMAEIYRLLFKRIEGATDEAIRASANVRASSAQRAAAVRKLEVLLQSQKEAKPAAASKLPAESPEPPEQIRALAAAKAALALAKEAQVLAAKEEQRVRDELAKLAADNKAIAKKPEAADDLFDQIKNEAAGGRP